MSNRAGVAGAVVIFSFVSILFVFISMFVAGGMNNYALNKLVGVADDFNETGLMNESYYSMAETTGSSFKKIVDYMDYFWLAAFISFVASSFVFSYFRKRDNLFNLFTMAVIGIIILTFVGGIFVDITYWFRDELFLAVFPQMEDTMPMFFWYLDNLAIVNLLLISINIVLNFVDLNLTKFFKRKEEEKFDEL